MAGVNLSEESARILATNSELVGTLTRSCKDETFLLPTPLQRRILEIGKSMLIHVPLQTCKFGLICWNNWKAGANWVRCNYVMQLFRVFPSVSFYLVDCVAITQKCSICVPKCLFFRNCAIQIQTLGNTIFITFVWEKTHTHTLLLSSVN